MSCRSVGPGWRRRWEFFGVLGFGIAPRPALRPCPGVTRAVGGETFLGARRALGTLRERRGPAALDAQPRGLPLGVLPAVALAVGPAPRFRIADRLALGSEPFGAGALGGGWGALLT